MGAKLSGAHAYGAWYPEPNDRRGPPWDYRWFWSEKFPERRPELGWYNLRDQGVVDDIVRQCLAGGLDFLSVCWYYSGPNGAPEGDVLLQGLKRTSVPGLRHCLAFDPRGGQQPIRNLDDWKAIIRCWAREFQDPHYLEVDGRPVVTMLVMEDILQKFAPLTGLTVKGMLDLARQRSGRNIYFIASGEATSHWVAQAENSGYDAFSAYNWQRGWVNRDVPTAGPSPKSYADLDTIYRGEWAYLAARLKIDFWIPTITGFDARPWNGVAIGDSTPQQLEAHWRAAYTVLMASDRCRATVCDGLDEHAEGSVLLGDDVNGRARMGLHRRIFKGLQ